MRRHTGTDRLERSALSLTWIALSGILFVAPMAGHASGGEWAGQETLVDGVRHVMNPAVGIEPARTIELEELWRIGGDTDSEEEFFGVLVGVLTGENGNIYLLDQQLSEIKVFSSDGQYLRTIGREGEGPGEFRRPSGMFFLPDGTIAVMQLAPGKIVLLSRTGEPVGERPIPVPDGAGFSLLFDGRSAGETVCLVLGTNQFEEGKFTQTRRLIRVDNEGNILTNYVTGLRTIEFATATVDERIWDGFENRWALDAKGRVYAVETWGQYEVTVWSPEGRKQMVIHREMKPRKRSDAELDRLRKVYEALVRQIPDAQLKLSDHDQDIFRPYVRDDGTLWVQNAYGAYDMPDGSLGVFDVFDGDGRFVQEVTLRGQGDPQEDAYFFVGDRLYVVTDFLSAYVAAQGGGAETEEAEAEPEPMSVICYRMGGADLASR